MQLGVIKKITSPLPVLTTDFTRALITPAIRITKPIIHKKDNVMAFSRAAYETLTDKSSPLENVPRPVIDYDKFEFTTNKVFGSRHTAIFPLGHATKIQDMETVIQEYDELGINVIIVPLPNMYGHEHDADKRSIDKVYKKHIETAILNTNSSIYDHIPHFHRISLITHSSSGAAFERAIKENDNLAAFSRAKFSNIVHQGILLDTVKSSYKFNPNASKGYKFFTRFPCVRDKKVGSTPLDRHHLKIPKDINLKKYQDSLKNNVEHGQAYWIKKASQRHVHSVVRDNETSSHFQQLERYLFSGREEDAACYKMVEYYARTLVEGAEHKILNNLGHNPLLESQKFRQQIASIVLNNKKPRLSMSEVILPTPEPLDKKTKNYAAWLPSLSTFSKA